MTVRKKIKDKKSKFDPPKTIMPVEQSITLMQLVIPKNEPKTNKKSKKK